MTMPTDAPPGDNRAFVHSWPVRIYYEDTDCSGLVYHANYLRFAERARTEMLRSFGVRHRELWEGAGIAFVVRHLSADYRAPARLDQAITVETRVRRVSGASIELAQSIVSDGIDLVRINLKLACITTDRRVARVPSALHAVLARLVPNNSGQPDGQ
jgi:acyl-CoA thioester hydrolase